MATKLGSLVVSLGLDAAEYTRGLEKSKADAKRAADDIQRALGAASGIGVALGVSATAGAAAVLLFTRSSIDAADHLLDLSKATNIAVGELGGIGFAASQAGTDLDGAAASLGKLNLTIAKAAAGDKDAAHLFDSMGISLRDASGATKSADLIFAEVADKFAGYAEGPEQAALANALFGKSYQSILPLLKDGAGALQENIAFYQQFGGVTAETARQADQFNDTLGKLALMARGAGNELVGQLLPSINQVADRLLQAAKDGHLFMQFLKELNNIPNPAANAGKGAADWLAGLFKDSPQERIAKLQDSVADLQRRLAENPGDRGLTAYLAKVQKRLAEVQASTSVVPDVAGAAFLESLPTSGAAFKKQLAPAPAVGGATGNGAKEVTSEAERYLKTLDNQLQTAQKLTEQEKALQDVRSLKGITNQLADQIIDRAAEIDASKRLQSQLEAEKKQVEDLFAAQRAQAEEGRRVFDATRTPAEALGSEIQRLNKLLEAGAISWDTYARATFDAQDAFDKAQNQGKETAKLIETSAQKAAATVQDTLGSGLYDTLSGNFHGIGDAFRSLLNRMVADALAAQITQALFGDSAPGKSPVGGGGTDKGWIGKLIGLFAGNFASGGYIPPGQWGMTGERGPEPVFGGRTGVTVRSAQENGGGTMVQAGIGTVNVGQGVSRGEVHAAIRQALGAQMAQIQRARLENRL